MMIRDLYHHRKKFLTLWVVFINFLATHILILLSLIFFNSLTSLTPESPSVTQAIGEFGWSILVFTMLGMVSTLLTFQAQLRKEDRKFEGEGPVDLKKLIQGNPNKIYKGYSQKENR